MRDIQYFYVVRDIKYFQIVVLVVTLLGERHIVLLSSGSNFTEGEKNGMYPDGVPCTTSVLDHLDTVNLFT